MPSSKATSSETRRYGCPGSCEKEEDISSGLKIQAVKVHTPAEKVIPHQVLFLRKHSHHNESMQVDAFTQHPEVVATHEVQVDEL